MIIKKIMVDHHHNWHNILSNALWVDWVIPKVVLVTSTYFLFYGKEANFPPNIFLISLQLLQATSSEISLEIKNLINGLFKSEEERDEGQKIS